VPKESGLNMQTSGNTKVISIHFAATNYLRIIEAGNPPEIVTKFRFLFPSNSVLAKRIYLERGVGERETSWLIKFFDQTHIEHDYGNLNLYVWCFSDVTAEVYSIVLWLCSNEQRKEIMKRFNPPDEKTFEALKVFKDLLE
jgi:hypothetical protein